MPQGTAECMRDAASSGVDRCLQPSDASWSVQETQAGQNEQLAMLKPQDFTTGIAIMSQDGHDYKLKYSRRPVLQLSCHMLSINH